MVRNKGAGGGDGMKVDELLQYLYPRAIKFTRFLGARGHIRAINLSYHIIREYKRQWRGNKEVRAGRKV